MRRIIAIVALAVFMTACANKPDCYPDGTGTALYAAGVANPVMLSAGLAALAEQEQARAEGRLCP